MKKLPEVAKRMRKTEVAKRIKKLRKALGKGQVEFAKILDVSQATVSSWELGKKIPARIWHLIFWALALDTDLALLPDLRWFWKKAEKYLQRIGVAGQLRLGKSGVAPVDGETIRVPRIRKTAEGSENTDRFLPFPAEFLPKPASTICLVIDETAEASDMFEPGDLIVLDTPPKDAKDPRPFWDQDVLVDISGGRPWSLSINPHGLSMGRLQCKLFRDRSALMDGKFSPPWWVVTLGAYYASDREWRGPIDEGLDIGRWYPFPDEKPSSIKEVEALEAEGWKRARNEIRLDEHCKILGRVIGRIRPPREEGK